MLGRKPICEPAAANIPGNWGKGSQSSGGSGQPTIHCNLPFVILAWTYSLKWVHHPSVQFSSVQLLNCLWPFANPWTAAHQGSLFITNSQSLPKLMSIEWVMSSRPTHPLMSLSPPAFNLAQHQGLFQWVSFFCIRWPKYWSFNISPSNGYSGLISFRMDWLELLAV